MRNECTIKLVFELCYTFNAIRQNGRQTDRHASSNTNNAKCKINVLTTTVANIH